MHNISKRHAHSLRFVLFVSLLAQQLKGVSAPLFVLMSIRWHLQSQLETWVWFVTPSWKKAAKTPIMVSTKWTGSKTSWPGSHVHDYTRIYHKPYWLLQQFDEWVTWESQQNTAARLVFPSEEIWSNNSCTHYASLASSQIQDWVQNTLDCL